VALPPRGHFDESFLSTMRLSSVMPGWPACFDDVSQREPVGADDAVTW
jgi:hypothetical protein